MELLSFVSGDNLFKYTFTLGLVMVVFSLVYPLQKKHEIELEIVNYNKDEKLLALEYNTLLKSVAMVEKESAELKKKTKHFIPTKKNKDKIRKEVLKFNADLDSVQKFKLQIKVKKINLEYNSSKINVLKSQAETFQYYACWILGFGIIFSSFGLISWTITTFKNPPQQ